MGGVPADGDAVAAGPARRRTRALAAVAGLLALSPFTVAGRADAAVPTFTVSQTTGLVSGQQVRVAWDGQPLGVPVGVFVVFQCAGLFDPSDYYRNCDELVLQDPAASSGSYDVTVRRQLIPDDLTLHTCNGTGEEQCYLVLVASETLLVNASLPITFRAPK
jgi:hypothetical protein